MNKLSRRGLFGIAAGGLLATTAPAALFWHQWQFNKDRIIQRLIAASDAQWDDPDMRWTAQEIEYHKRLGGWPEYGASGSRMRDIPIPKNIAPTMHFSTLENVEWKIR